MPPPADVGVPIRIHGDMYGKRAGHEYMVITRNEEGSVDGGGESRGARANARVGVPAS